MKTFKLTLILLALTIGSVFTAAGQAQFQVIHNSIALSGDVIDIYIDGERAIDDFAWRTASPFLTVDSDRSLDIAIADCKSKDASNPLLQTEVYLTQGTFIATVNDIKRVSQGNTLPVRMFVYEDARQSAPSGDQTSVLVFHGSNDAPMVDVLEVSDEPMIIVNDLDYGQYAGYLDLPTADYKLEIRDRRSTTTLANYSAPLSTLGLEGAALTVVASGLINPPADAADALAFGLYVALPSGGDLIALPTNELPRFAQVQVIHNSADKEAEMVDVWLDDQLILDNFMFRTATPFVDVPAGKDITVSIQTPDSQSPEGALAQYTYNLAPEGKYILMANGLISKEGYDPIQPFNLYAKDVKMFSSLVDGTAENVTKVITFHGATDAPTVDVVEVGAGAGTIIDDLSYGEYTNFLNLPTDNYILEVRDETGTATVATYEAPLADLGLNGTTITVVASGFLNPANNSDGAAFGLWVALPDGGALVPLPEVKEETMAATMQGKMARIQMIHNSEIFRDAMVDVYVDRVKVMEDFAYRYASPFLSVSAYKEVTIGLAPAGSKDASEAIFTKTAMFEDKAYIAVVSDNLFDSPSTTPIELFVFDNAMEKASSKDVTSVAVFHGSKDAPVVDVYETGVGAGMIIDDLMYGQWAGYLDLPPVDYRLQIRDRSGEFPVATYAAPLGTLGLGGQAISVLASGLLSPAAEEPTFGLYVALQQGGMLIPLPVYTPSFAQVQVIHNSADVAAEYVDVWLNDQLILDDFAFRTATPFVDLPAEEDIDIVIQPSTSTDTADALARFTYNLEANSKYILIANGIVSGAGYEPIQPFDIYVNDVTTLFEENITDETKVMVFHGATDAPAVDVVETAVGAGTIINDLAYGEWAGYLYLPTANFVLDIRDETGTVTVASYAAPLSDLRLGSTSITVVASGFLNPDNNNNGEAFGLWVALPQGGELIPLPTADENYNYKNTTNVAESTMDVESITIYPNPATEYVNLNYRLNESAKVSIEMIDLTGTVVKRVDLGYRGDQSHSYQLDVSDLSQGLYIMSVTAGSSRYSDKIRKF